MSKPAAIAIQTFAASPEAVYDSILDRNMIGKFMFGPLLREETILHVDLDARIGGGFSYKVRRGRDEIDHTGEFLELARPRRIAFTWSAGAEPSNVIIDIAPTQEGCEVRLTHELAPGWEEFADRARGAWEKMLGVLSTLVPSRPEVAATPDRISLIFIKAEAQDVWDAVVSEAISRQYFFGHAVEVAHTPGGVFRLRRPDGTVSEEGVVLVRREPNILRVTWKPTWSESIPMCEVEWLIESPPTADGSPLTRLTVNEYHQNGVPPAFIDSGRTGWAIILSGVKSLLETGTPLPGFKPDMPESGA